MASKVYFADLRADVHENLQQKLTRLMKTAGMGDIDFQDKFVAIKLHFGEPGNLAFLRPNWARTVADFVKERGGKPFLTDCNTLYVGGRKNALDHMDSAMLNGFNPMTTGCQIIIADGLKGNDEVEVPVAGGEYVKNAKIGRALMDADIVTADGSHPPQLELHVPQSVADNYRRLLAADPYPPCREAVMRLPSLTIHSWMSALGAERIDDKGVAIERRVAQSDGSWEKAFFITLARAFGFGTNSDAFEQWATALPLMQVAHHRDHPMQVEAMFLGTAGLLDADAMPQRQREAALSDAYFTALRREYAYLAHKFSLTAMPRMAWRFMRLRPQNSPYIRLSQLATLYCSRRADLSRVASCATLDDVGGALTTEVGDYWRTHYSFGNESKANAKRLSAASVQLLVVNAVVPMLYAYGRHRQDETLIQRAARLMEELPPEDNTYIRLWKECGVKAENAADTQAMIQLHRRY